MKYIAHNRSHIYVHLINYDSKLIYIILNLCYHGRHSHNMFTITYPKHYDSIDSLLMLPAEFNLLGSKSRIGRRERITNFNQ